MEPNGSEEEDKSGCDVHFVSQHIDTFRFFFDLVQSEYASKNRNKTVKTFAKKMEEEGSFLDLTVMSSTSTSGQSMSPETGNKFQKLSRLTPALQSFYISRYLIRKKTSLYWPRLRNLRLFNICALTMRCAFTFWGIHWPFFCNHKNTFSWIILAVVEGGSRWSEQWNIDL